MCDGNQIGVHPNSIGSREVRGHEIYGQRQCDATRPGHQDKLMRQCLLALVATELVWAALFWRVLARDKQQIIGFVLDESGMVHTATGETLEESRRFHVRQALFVTTSPGPDRPLDDHPEAWLLHALYDGSDLPWILVDLGDAERFRDDAHPNPAGARKIAGRIVAALRQPAARGH